MKTSKKETVKELVAHKHYKKALQICKDWNYDCPEYSNILRLGYECLLYPEFYKQIGKDTEKAYQEAVALLINIYT